MKKITYLLFFVLSAFIANAQAPDWNWVVAPQISGTEMSRVYDSTIDADGNMYVCGEFSGTAVFGDNTVVNNSGELQFFLIKYNPLHEVVWVKTGGGSFPSAIQSVTTDANGNIYITGSFKTSITMDGITLSNTGYVPGFIAKLDSNGTAVWAKTPLSQQFYGNKIIVAPDNYIYIAASYGVNSMQLDSTLLTHTGTTNDVMSLIKLTPEGSVVWMKSSAVSNGEHIYDLTTDGESNIYLVGKSGGTLDLGGVSVGPAPGGFIFLAKYNNNGQPLWLKYQTAGLADDGSYIEGTSMARDQQGNLITIGYFQGTVTIPGSGLQPLSSDNFSNDVVVAKYDSNGTIMWIKAVGGESDEFSTDVAVDIEGNIYLSYYSNSTSVHVDGNTEDLEYPQNAILTKLAPDGSFQWNKTGGSNNAAGFLSLLASEENNVLAAGTYLSDVNLDNLSLESEGWSIFLAQMGTDTAGVPGKKFNGYGLYPNPAKNTLNINTEFISGQNYYITDMTGRTVKTGKIGENGIDISSLGKGMYTLSINGINSKFIKE